MEWRRNANADAIGTVLYNFVMPSMLASRVLIFVGATFGILGMLCLFGPLAALLSLSVALLGIGPYVSTFVLLVGLLMLLIGVAGWASRQPVRHLLRFGLLFIGLAGGCVFLVGRVYNGVDNILGLPLLTSAATFVLIDLDFLVIGAIYGSRQAREKRPKTVDLD